MEFNSWPCLPLSLSSCALPSASSSSASKREKLAEMRTVGDREQDWERVSIYYTGQGRRQGELGEEKIMEAVAIKLWVQNVREGN